MSEYILEMKHITKRFASVVANEDVNLSVKRRGPCSLGENGAGKSTLMNCLYGMYDSYEGEIWFNGQKVVINDPNRPLLWELNGASAFYADSGPDRNRKCGSWPKGK